MPSKKTMSLSSDSNREKTSQWGISSSFLKDLDFYHFLHTFINSIPVYILVIDPKTYTVVMANKKLAQSLGVPVKNMIGKNSLDFLPSREIRDQRKTYADQTIQNKKSMKFIDKRGDRYFENYSVPILDEHDNVKFVVAVMIEITEQSDMKRILADREQLFSSLIQNSEDICILATKEGTVFYTSPSIRKILGYKTDLVGLSIFDYIHQDDVEIFKDFFKQILSKPGITKQTCVRVKDANDTYHYVEGFVNNQLHNENLKAIIMNAHDISKRVRAQEKLAETMNYLDNIINYSREVIFVVNKNGRITLWNRSAERITGIKSHQIKGKSVSKINFIQNTTDLLDFIQNTFAGEVASLQKLIISTKQEVEAVLKPSISLLRGYNEEISDLIFICDDITDKFKGHETFSSGTSNILYDEDDFDLKKLLRQFILEGKKGFFITRKPLNIDPIILDNKNLCIGLFHSLKNSSFKSIENLEELKKSVLTFIKNNSNSAVFINRIDYLFNRYDFYEVLLELYKINDYVKKYQSMLFIRINKNQLTEKECSSLEEEFTIMKLEEGEDIQLEDSLFSILEFIYRENRMDRIVNQNRIVREFNISKVTAKKRIDGLIDKKVLFIKRKGRSKQLFVTKKGESIIKKKTIK